MKQISVFFFFLSGYFFHIAMFFLAVDNIPHTALKCHDIFFPSTENLSSTYTFSNSSSSSSDFGPSKETMMYIKEHAFILKKKKKKAIQV